MPVMKFKVIYEDDDSVFRDVEIKPSQTFQELEAVIVSSYNLPLNGTGNFYTSNDNWQKGKRIFPLAQVEEKSGNTKKKAKAQAIPALVAFIDDPHQHFIYEYKGQTEFSFLVELLTLGGAEKSGAIYPVMVKSQGPSPFKKEEAPARNARKAAITQAVEAEEEEEDEADGEEDVTAVFVADKADEEDLDKITGDEEILEADDRVDDEDDEIAEEENLGGDEDFDPEALSEDFGGSNDEDEF